MFLLHYVKAVYQDGMYERTSMRCWVVRHVVHSDSKYLQGHAVREEQKYSTIYQTHSQEV